MLGDWVAAGGDLIAMRPDKQLAGLLGLTDTGTTLANAYMRVDASRQPGAGIVSQTMQFHGAADRYALNGATSVADLYSSASAATTAPAVTMRSVGANGGRAAAFTYDLARSVVYTRQGNPAWAGQERDGFAPIRSDDLFFGAAPFDPQPNWVDLSKVAIPQADEQQRLLVNLIGVLTADKKPQPRFWYFPRGVKAAVIMTGDDHAQGGTAGRWNQYLAASPAGCSVAQWECIRGTSYVYPSSPLTDAQAASFAAQGFEVSVHVNTNCADFTQQALDGFFTDQLVDFHAEYPSVSGPVTHRTHCIAYSDWSSTPKVELAHGMRLDGNYYYWPPTWVVNVPGMFTGSGMPMRFADLDGSMIDVYQATTQMTDESEQTYPFTIDTLLDRAVGPTGYYGAFNANMHTDNAVHAGSDAIVASAKARGVPVVSAQQMLTWLDGRGGSTFQNIGYTGDVLSFRVAVGAGATGLRGMVPATFAGKALKSMTRDGAPLAYTRETIKGVDYAFFPATAGAFTAAYEADTTAPSISAVAAVAAPDGSATVTWTTDEAADSRVDYGTSPAALNQSVSDPLTTTAHSVRLTGLTPGATYHYRVRSADGSTNAATAPAGAPGDVRGAGDQVPRRHRDRDRHAARRRRRGARRRRQRLLRGHVDHERDADHLVVRLVHRRAGRPQRAERHVHGPQLPLLHAGHRGVALDRQHVAAAQLGRRREHGDHARRPRPAGRGGQLREPHRRGPRPRALHDDGELLRVGRGDEDHLHAARGLSRRLRRDALPRPAEAEPALIVRFEREPQRAVERQLVVAEQVDQRPVRVQCQRGLRRAGGEVVHGDDGRVAPVGPVREHRGIVLSEQRPVAPAELRALSPAPDQALHPVQERARVAALRGDVDLAIAERTVSDRRAPGLLGGREAAVPLGGPLHRRAHRVAALDRPILGHPDLLAVEQHRCAREREHQRVDEPHAARVAAQHPWQPAAQTAAVHLQVLLRPERGEHLFSLALRELVERQLVVVAHEVRPLAVGRRRRECAQRIGQRPRVARGRATGTWPG